LARQLDGLRSPRTLLASSPAFHGPLASRDGEVRATGFWFFDDPAWRAGRPGPRLERFVEAEPPPLVLAFGSTPLADPALVLAVHARAAALLGRRLVVQRGWAGLTRRCLPADVSPVGVQFVGPLSHDWLLARAAALILPGGIGLIARALRVGCPLVVEPYGNDGFFNAGRVVRLGLGVAMHPYRVTPLGLARVLEEKVLTPACRARAAALGTTLRSEDGLAVACDQIEEWLRSDGVP
jgi:UDP:flavonoid glycosyltransferase YjiC (YdhE family)